MLFLTPPPAQLEMRGEERQEGPVLCLRLLDSLFSIIFGTLFTL